MRGVSKLGNLTAAMLTATVLSPAAAGAASLSMNEVVLVADTTLEECKARGRAALSQAKLEPIPDSPGSVFGVGPNGLLAAIYCLPQHGIAMVAIAGDTSAETRPVLGQLLGFLNGG